MDNRKRMRMRNFEKLMLFVVVVALFCDLAACINTDNGTSLRGGASPQRNLSYTKKDKKGKYGDDDDDGGGKGAKKYIKISKGYKGEGFFGDDDGGGKGAKKYKNYNHDTMSDTSSSGSTESRIDGSESDERNPEDDSDHIIDNIRGIVPKSKPDSDGSPPTIEDDGTIGETTTIETNPADETELTESRIEDPSEIPVEEPTQPVNEPTDSTIEDPTQSPVEEPTQSKTEESTDTIEIETENEDDPIEIANKPLEPVFSSLIERSRTVQIKHPGANECMTYDYTLDNMAVFMKECSTANSRKDDYWEILQITTANGDLVYLRHKSTQLCIPINSESPERHFNCFRYFGMNEAVADSFTGLVDCNSDFAAAFEIGSSRSLHMSNSGCEEATFTDQGVVFMTYNQAELTDDVRVVVWGGQNLLEMEDVVEEYNFNSEWAFVDV